MEITKFSFGLLIIFIPGLLAFYIVDALTYHKEAKFHDKLLRAYLFGVLSYSIYYLLTLLFKADFEILKYFTNDTVIYFTLGQLKDVFSTSIISIAVGLTLSWTKNRKILFRIAQGMGITKKFADLDVWSYIFNSPDNYWIRVRDYNKNIIYQGWVEAFSDSTGKDELLLTQVSRFDLHSGKPFDDNPLERLYIPISRDDMTVELIN
ncbi:MAG: hypothetical protein IIB40_10045 [Candidatus Marinimicrobia bacterium]|nr:hypothetical protein [Candidatus Neomarinimicrobiota bacterium]